MTNPATKNDILNSAPLISILEILQILLILSVCMQISSQLVPKGAGGRGEALGCMRFAFPARDLGHHENKEVILCK